MLGSVIHQIAMPFITYLLCHFHCEERVLNVWLAYSSRLGNLRYHIYGLRRVGCIFQHAKQGGACSLVVPSPLAAALLENFGYRRSRWRRLPSHHDLHGWSVHVGIVPPARC